MNALLSSLAEICREQMFTPKRLVVNSYAAGHGVLEALAHVDMPWLNLAAVTPVELAFEVVGSTIEEQGFELINDDQTLFLIDETLDEMAGTDQLQYFFGLESAEGLAGILKSSLMELRMAGISSAYINPGDFVDEQKGKEIKALLKGYENRLREGKMLDPAGLYKMALELLEQGTAQGKEALYLIPEQLELDFLSFSFLQRLTDGQRLVLPAEEISGLSRPEGFFFPAEKKPEKNSSFSWLFDVENAPPQDDMEPEIFHAYGASCEVKEVFRRLQKDNIPADQAVVCYTNAEVYLPLILALSSTYRIPVTFADGVPAVYTRPGKLLLGLLSWMEGQYPAQNLYRLFTEGSIKVSSGMAIGRLLRRAGIGWGRDRYLPCLQALEEGLKVEAEAAEREEREGLRDYLLGQKEQLRELHEFISFLLEKIPPPDENDQVDFRLLCRGLSEILDVCASKANSWDSASGEAFQEQLAQASLSLRGKIPVRTAIQRLKARLGNLHIGACGFEPGYLHVASIRQGEWFFRPNTFLVGLDDGHFPGSGLQDPVLLDDERAALSPNLKIMATSPERSIYRLNRFLASCRGKITLSFPSFDPAEGRASFPAPVLLQAYRLKTGNPGADYSSFVHSLGRPAAYFPEEEMLSLSEEEWWGCLVLQGKKDGGLRSVKNCYPGLQQGLLAEEARKEKSFSVFDGKVLANAEELDPRQNQKALSATALEMLATCPFAYFLRHILKVEPPDEQIFDPSTWLDPPSRGLLLHRVYADYLRRVCAKKASQASRPTADRDLLTEIAEELIVETKENIPPPSPVAYEYEKEELLRGLEVFLKVEEELWQSGSIPVYLELPFGFSADDTTGDEAGRQEPLEVELPGGDIVRLRGRIDRIDRVSPRGVHRIWDFKTGSTYNFDERSYIKQGRQIQHILYSLAAEKVLRREDPQATVEEAGYIFPTEKGEGQYLLRKQDKRGEAMYALGKMLDLLSAGVFCATHDQDRCGYCQYQPVCRFPQSVQRIKEKLSCEHNTELLPWKELQAYE